MRLIFHIVTIAASAAAQVLCGSESQVLFQSNAYADSIVPSSPPYQGGSVLQTQKEWDEFLGYFQPNNHGESLFRTSIDFSTEKVVVATYFTTSTCLVDISNAQLECSDTDSTVQMELIIDVFDASANCDMKCMALGQVVYAVAVPKAWVIDEDTGFQINVMGPRVSGGPSASPYVHAASTSSPEAILVDTQTTIGATTTTTQSSGELSTSSSSATTFTSFETTLSSRENILLDSQTTTGATTITVMSEEYSTYSNDVTGTASSETTSPPTTTTTEPSLIENSQLRGTHDIIVEDVTIPVEDPSEASDHNFSIEVIPKTDTATTVMAIKPSIPVDRSPATSPTSKTANEPENASISLRQHHLISFILFSIGIFSIGQ